MNSHSTVKTMVIALLALFAWSSLASSQSEGLVAYEEAILQWIPDYLIATAEMTVRIGDNEPAAYVMKMWTQGSDRAVSVITAADVDFLLGLALLQEGNEIIAWWPTLERSKTFASERTDEEIGLSAGLFEQVGQYPSDYEPIALDDAVDEWHVELRPRLETSLFARAVVVVNKAERTITGAEFYNDEDVLIEIDRILSYVKLESPTGGSVSFPSSLEIEDLEENKITTIIYTEVAIPESIAETQFTLDALKQLAEQALAGEL